MKSFDETKYYLGKLCLSWHNYEGTGKSLRGHTRRRCVVCVHQDTKKRQAMDNGEYLRKYMAKYRALNKEKIRKWSKEHRKDNPEYYKVRNDKYKARPEVKARDRVAKLKARSTPEGLLKLRSISRRSGVRVRWKEEIVVAKLQPEPKRSQLLESVEHAMAVRVKYLELRMILKEK